MKTLNITNGDGAANIIKQSAVIGDVLPWRDPMHHGPFPTKLSLSELGKLRATYLAGPDADPTEVERDFQLRDQHLNASEGYDKITLWFEHDLLDQLQILQILDWFSGTPREGSSLDMICVDRFPGKPRFRGIGELSPEEMASLTELRYPVGPRLGPMIPAICWPFLMAILVSCPICPQRCAVILKSSQTPQPV